MKIRYHVNPETGNPGRCEAKKQCRFGSIDHYDSADEARSAFEQTMKDSSSNLKTLEAYDRHVKEYIQGSLSAVSGGMKEFIDESFAMLPPNSTILELGAGFGRDAAYLEQRGFHVIASDAADAFVDELRERGFEAKKLNALTDELPSTDAVFANAVFLHFSRDELRGVLSKIQRSLKDGGLLSFTVKEGDGEGWSSEKLNAPRHFTYWREESLRAVVEDAGFEGVAIGYDHAGPTAWLQLQARSPQSTNE